MTHATDKDNNESLVSHTTPRMPGKSTDYSLQYNMKAAILRYVNQDVSDQSLLCMVVDRCYTLDETIAYVGTAIGPNDMGYELRLRTVRAAISTALQYYTYGRKYPS